MPKTIKLNDKILSILDKNKKPTESYSVVIERMIKVIPETSGFTKEGLKGIQEIVRKENNLQAENIVSNLKGGY